MNNTTTEQAKTIFNDEISQLSAWGLFKTLLGSVVRSSVRATSSVEAGFMVVETTIGLAQNEIDALAAEQVIRLDDLAADRVANTAKRDADKSKE